MAALTAAFELSEGSWHERFEHITVYQRGWRLGGKGASGRGPNGRIEEHGLHMLLGYYDCTFDLMRRCYDELDRASTDPDCPIRTWDDAVFPTNRVGVTDRQDGRWLPWVAEFTSTSGQPGGPGGPGRPGGTGSGGGARSWPMAPATLLGRSLQLLGDFLRSVDAPRGGRSRDRAYLSSSPFRAPSRTSPPGDVGALLRGAAILGLTLPVSFARRLLVMGSSGGSGGSGGEWAGMDLLTPLKDLRDAVQRLVASDPAARRSFHLVEIVTANIIGILADGLLEAPDGIRSIDHLDYREWLLHHGIDPTAVESPLLRGMYDLTFAYENADISRPKFSAGLGLQLATRMLYSYSGGLFWKMRAGMGEVIFAPLYQVLRRRGVRFRFFHRVDAVHVSRTDRSIESIDIGIQAEPSGGEDTYSPLTEVKGLPCWPAAPLAGQLLRPDLVEGRDLESFWSPPRDHRRITLRAGEDFDQIVFAISAGMVPYLCTELLESSPAWQAMASNLGTVATQSLQLWLNADEKELGWPGNPGDVISGFTEPFDTWASMSHLAEYEDWPVDEQPRSIAYFCSPFDARALSVDDASQTVLAHARNFLERDVKALWPGSVGPEGFRWDLLHEPSPSEGPTSDTPPPDRLESQYWRANVDPSDLYVQSLPGTGRHRLAPGETDFDNLTIAGDWTDCGLNAGCIEAAAISGHLAALAVIERIAPA